MVRLLEIHTRTDADGCRWFCDTPGVKQRRKIISEDTQKSFLEKILSPFNLRS
jgi:hypothetical protein